MFQRLLKIRFIAQRVTWILIIPASHFDAVTFPNPASHIINVNMYLEETASVSIDIFYVTGQLMTNKIYGKQNGAFSTAIDCSRLDNGIYLMKIKADKNETVKKIIKHQ